MSEKCNCKEIIQNGRLLLYGIGGHYAPLEYELFPKDMECFCQHDQDSDYGNIINILETVRNGTAVIDWLPHMRKFAEELANSRSNT